MSREQRTTQLGWIRGDTKVDSAFRLDIKNTLGISATAQRNKLSSLRVRKS